MNREEFLARYAINRQGRAVAKHGGSKNRRNKFGNTPLHYKGQRYDSKLEAKRAQFHDLRILSGEVLFWGRQTLFECGENDDGSAVWYKVDFTVWLATGDVEIEDVKGPDETPNMSKIRALRLFRNMDIKIIRDGPWSRF